MRSLVTFAIENGGSNTIIPTSNELIENLNQLYIDDKKNTFHTTNPSCVFYKDELLMNCRAINYVKDFCSNQFNPTNYNINHIYNDVNCIHSFNLLYTKGTVQYLPIPEGNFLCSYNGLEDVRMVVWNDKLYVYGTRWDIIDGKGRICIYELNEEFEPVHCIVCDANWLMDCEKNWAAIEDKPFTFIYSTNPLIIVEVNPNTGEINVIKETPYKYNIPSLRGSTPLVKLPQGGYLTITHESPKYQNNIFEMFYTERFVIYTNDLDIGYVSEPFVFTNDLCEFCCGLQIKNDKVYITYSELDCTSNLLEFPIECLNDAIFGNYGNAFNEEYFYQKGLVYRNNDTLSRPLFNKALLNLHINDSKLIEYLQEYIQECINDETYIKNNRTYLIEYLEYINNYHNNDNINNLIEKIKEK